MASSSMCPAQGCYVKCFGRSLIAAHRNIPVKVLDVRLYDSYCYHVWVVEIQDFA
jgi:hypothetical protein